MQVSEQQGDDHEARRHADQSGFWAIRTTRPQIGADCLLENQAILGIAADREAKMAP